MPVVTGVQRAGGARLEVWFKTKPAALVGQERIMFGGLATTVNEGAAAESVLTARTPAASACAPLAAGRNRHRQTAGCVGAGNIVESVRRATGDEVLTDIGRHGVGRSIKRRRGVHHKKHRGVSDNRRRPWACPPCFESRVASSGGTPASAPCRTFRNRSSAGLFVS